MFTKDFPAFACDGDTIRCTVEGFDCIAFVERDDNSDAPDQRQDGFWPSLDPSDAGYIGSKSKSSLRRHMKRAKAIMDAWRNDEWDYCGVCVVVERNGVCLTGKYGNALWGIERNYPSSHSNAYLRATANELLDEALEQAKAKLTELCAS